jgi:hypothetical protein
VKGESTINWPRAFWDTLTIVVFLALLWLPTLDHFFKLDRAPMPVENRQPAAWPQFQGIGQSREFVAGIENYFNDHFGFRKRLVRWNNRWKGQLFHDAPRREVLIGQNGWLFYAGPHMMENWARSEMWSAKDLEKWRRLLETRRDWLRARGINYIFVVPPDKHTVYPEFLPTWMEKITKPSKLQQFVDYMKTRSTVEVLDLSQALIEAKKIRIDYLKTDTHWNAYGAFVAYRAMLQALSRQMPALQPLPLDAYDWKYVPHPAGDLARMLGSPESYAETEAVVAVALRPLPSPELLYDPIRLPHHGPEEKRPRYTLNEKTSGKAIVFRDSFANTWFSFLGQHFREVVYIWHYDWDRSLIEREKPDVVIDEMLERFFNTSDPVDLLLKDQSSETNSPILRASFPARYPDSPRPASSQTNSQSGSAR